MRTTPTVIPGRALRSSARGRGPICGRPPSLQEMSDGFGRIACGHMSGLFVRSHLTAGPAGIRDAGSKQEDGIYCHWVPRSVPRLRSIDHTNYSFSSKLLWLRRECAFVERTMRSSGRCHWQQAAPLKGRARGAERSPHEAQRSAPRVAVSMPVDGLGCNARR